MKTNVNSNFTSPIFELELVHKEDSLSFYLSINAVSQP